MGSQQGSQADEIRARLAEFGILESDVEDAVDWVCGDDGLEGRYSDDQRQTGSSF